MLGLEAMEEAVSKDKKLCECGCGELIPKINKKFKPAKYKHGHNPQKKGILSPSWKGGKTFREGYILIRDNQHPNNSNGYVKEHRWIMEKHIGRYLSPEEIVHHKNGIKTDNRIENLELTSMSEHINHHTIWTYERKVRGPYKMIKSVP